MILRTVSESSTTMTSGGRGGSGGTRRLGATCGVSTHRASNARHVGALRELHRIDDQHDLAGAQHRRARNARHARELRPDVLDHDFLVADHLVDVDRGALLAAAQQQHRVVARRLGIVAAARRAAAAGSGTGTLRSCQSTSRVSVQC